MKILLAGEGVNDLGRWALEPMYRDRNTRGVIEALLQKIRPEGWRIADGILWKRIRKYKSGGHRQAETRAVLQLGQRARERGFDAFVFVRDRDGDEQREKDFRKGLEALNDGSPEAPVPNAPPRAGGIAVERIESWVLALTGASRTEDMSDDAVDAALAKHGAEAKSTEAFVNIIDGATLAAVPKDARSLSLWLEDARRLLERVPVAPATDKDVSSPE